MAAEAGAAAGPPLRAAVVGTGFGCRVHVPALRASGFDVVALVGRDRDKTERRAAKTSVAHACLSLAEALALGVDAVTIATPPDTHAALAHEAIAAGCRGVLCEKPFTLDAAEARRLADAAGDAGVVAYVGHEFRFAEDRATVARLLREGAVGEPRLAALVSWTPLAADPAARVPEWWFDPARGGGWLGASGSHQVDTVRVWLGDVEAVSAGLPVVSARDPATAAEDTFDVRFRTRSGATGALQQTAGAWGPSVGMTRVAGTGGTVWIDDGGVVWQADPTAPAGRPVDVPDDLRLPSPPDRSDDPRQRFTHLELGPYTRLCETFRDAIGGSPPAGAGPQPATFADGVAVMAALDAVRASAAAGGRWVTVADVSGPPPRGTDLR